jgi:hypothetical protein
MNDVVLHMQLEDGYNTTVADLVRCVTMLEELMLPEYSKNIFTLWMSSGLLGKLQKDNASSLMIPMYCIPHSQSPFS